MFAKIKELQHVKIFPKLGQIYTAILVFYQGLLEINYLPQTASCYKIKGMKIPAKLLTVYDTHVRLMNSLQDVLLLILRLYFGYRFMMAGWGKLHNIPDIADYFSSLGIPYPLINAYLASVTECFGGLCLLVGLASRIATVPLAFTMIIAYITADHEAVMNIFNDPDKFLKAEPFLFMLTSLLVLFFGAGKFSIDRILTCCFRKS